MARQGQASGGTRLSWRAAPALAALLLAGSAAAQGYDPRYQWRTLSTPRFRIHFHQGEEALARRVAEIGRAHV